MMMKYRRDIDGLRASAVIPVILFHLGIPGFSGGYIGVDVFFVISGFLMTRIIIEEIEQGSFTLSRFYERRIRRIFPALICMMAVTAIAGLWILTPGDLMILGKTMGASTFFAANIFFWREAGYFAGQAGEYPLLHLWSLAVEEQFYILFPLYMIFLALCAKRRWFWPSVAVFLLSFILSVWGVFYKPTATFYLLPTRGWELIAGSLLAMGNMPQIKNRYGRECLGIAALGLIIAPIIFYTKQTSFPGLNALAPCLGAAMLIYLGQSKAQPVMPARILSLPLFVQIGLISYSLYLWHWPIIVYANYLTFGELTYSIQALILILTCVLSVLSWRYVEQPFRNKNFIKARWIYSLSGLSIMVITCMAACFYFTNGLPARFTPELATMERENRQEQARIEKCDHPLDMQEFGLTAGMLCALGDERAAPDYIVIGDSHAMALRYAISDLSEHHGRAGYLLSNKGCAFIPGLRYDNQRDDQQACDNFTQQALDFIEAQAGIKDVIIISRWSRPIIGSLQFSGAAEAGSSLNMYTDKAGRIRTAEARIDHISASLPAMIEGLTHGGKKVYINTPIPEIGYHVPQILLRSAHFGKEKDIRFSVADYQMRHRWFFNMLPALENSGAIMIRPEKLLCDAAYCHAHHNGQPLYFDDDHLNKRGADLLIPALNIVFQ